MPSVQEIERLKTILNELADEPQVRAEQGETIEEVFPPGQDLAEGPGDLLGRGAQAGAPAPAKTGAAPEPTVGPDESFDVSSMIGSDADLGELDSFEDFDFGGSRAAAPPGAAPPAAAPKGPRAEPPGPAPVPEEPVGVGAEAEAGEAELGGPEVGEAEAAEEDVLAALGLAGEDFAVEPPAAGPAEEAPGTAEALPEEDFIIEEIPSLEEPPGEEEGPVFGEAGGAEELPGAEPESFEIGGEGDEFGIPPGLLGPGEEGGPAGAEAEGEVEAAAGGGEELGAPEAAEGFELPEEFALPELAEEAGVPGFEEAPIPEESPEEELELPEDLGEIEGLFAPSEEELPGEELPEGEVAVEGAAPAGAFGEEPFELPEEFRMPEEIGAGLPEEEAPPAFEAEGEAPAEPSQEEAEFLRALQEEILPGGEEERGEALPAGEHVDLEAPSVEAEAAIPEAQVPGYEEFSLEGLGEEFGIPEEAVAAEIPGEIPQEIPVEIPAELPPELRAELGAEAPPVEAAPPARGAPERVEAEALGLAAQAGLSDREFAVLRKTLARLPRNLKIAIEELIGEKELAGEALWALLRLLAEGAAPAAVAAEVSRITGTRIRIPASFEKLTGLEFEEERRRFGYAFRENILPILRVAALSLGVVALLSFLGYRYVYRPVQAQVLYRQGYNQIERQRYQLANERFDQALGYWVFKGWFYRYAEGFAGQRQYTLAAAKYEELLRRFPGDRRGILDYAAVLTGNLAGYERAEELVTGLLEENLRDYDALLALGDNYLEWAAEAPPDEAPSLYEKARFHYASIIDYYGRRDEVLLRMMRYFVRTDKAKQTRDLKAFLDDSSLKGVPPELYASVYAEVAGYWMDKGEYDGIADMLFNAMEAESDLPEVHFNFARYYLHVRDAAEEARALRATLGLLEDTQPLTKRRLLTLIDAYRRYGENFFRLKEYLEAERNFRAALARIEEGQAQRIFGPEEMFGQVYEDQGDIYYYVSRDLTAALDHYLKAVDNGHRPARLDYKIGYIHYNRDRFEDALLRFSAVVDQNPRNENALFALGNALYFGGFYSSAQGYYLRLLDLLESREERIPLMLIHENPEHRALAESIMKTYNNLGITLNRLAGRSRDPDKESAALVNLTFSSEYFDTLSRDPETAVRGITRNLAYLNQRGILYPESGFEPQIYTRIPIDLEAKGF